jgi:hypothetical protein
MIQKPIKFFKRFLLITILSVIVIPVSIGLLSIGFILEYIAVFLILVDGLILVRYWILSIYYLIRALLDKNIKNGYVIRFVNVLFTTLVVGIFGLFYFYFILGLFIILMPFLA